METTAADALRDALAEVIAHERAAWRREREAMEAEMRAALAELRAKVAEERALSAKVDGKPSTARTLRHFTDAAADAVARAIAEMQAAAERGEAERNAKHATALAEMTARTFRICGTWHEAGAYAALDVVALGGSSFVAKIDNPGPCPGDGWQLLASRGKSGRGRGAP